jgi:hypothetical protein
MRQSIGQDAASVAAEIDTPSWQLSIRPSVPEYWRATPTEKRPFFGKPVSSTIHASGTISAVIRRARFSRTASHDHGD